MSHVPVIIIATQPHVHSWAGLIGMILGYGILIGGVVLWVKFQDRRP